MSEFTEGILDNTHWLLIALGAGLLVVCVCTAYPYVTSRLAHAHSDPAASAPTSLASVPTR